MILEMGREKILTKTEKPDELYQALTLKEGRTPKIFTKS